MPSTKLDEMEIRRRHAADCLDAFVIVAAHYVIQDIPDAAGEDYGVADLVLIGRSAIATRWDQWRITTRGRFPAFDQTLIQDLLGCATDAMVNAWTSTSAPAAVNTTKSTAGPSQARTSKRTPGSH